jgi:hypothetical protein
MVAYDSPAKSYGLLGPSATAIYSTEWAYITDLLCIVSDRGPCDHQAW